MLSYQHLYHAGCLADVHKHAALATMLGYLTRKDKAITYIETHAARGLYDLSTAPSRKTGEAESGIMRFSPEDLTALSPIFTRVIRHIHNTYGPTYYPGSPMIASHLLRDYDRLHLCELHPQEFAALKDTMAGKNTVLYQLDGYAATLSLCPPTPRRGFLLIDPSFEVKEEYAQVADFIGHLLACWSEATIMLWYPILAENRHIPMIESLRTRCASIKQAGNEVFFQQDKGMVGSGLFVLNPPFGYQFPDFNAVYGRLVG